VHFSDMEAPGASGRWSVVSGQWSEFDGIEYGISLRFSGQLACKTVWRNFECGMRELGRIGSGGD
jgi:hypothetical protein